MKKLLTATLLTLPLLANTAFAVDNADLLQKAVKEMGSAPKAKGPDNSGGEFSYAKDRNTAAEQKAIYEVIARYQDALNAGDTNTILSLFAPESYSQWNKKLTADTTQERREQYSNLFKEEKFVTNFAFDSIWVNGNTAVVRTHHHFGSVVTNLKEKKSEIDLNREIFVMQKINGEWKIYLYTFNENPLQGVA